MNSKLRQVDIALRIAGFTFHKRDLEKIMKLIHAAGPGTTMQECVAIIDHVNSKYEEE